MPNQKHPDKKLIGYNARPEIINAVDKFAKSQGLDTRASALEALLREALEARGIKVPQPPSRGYLPDIVAKRNAGN